MIHRDLRKYASQTTVRLIIGGLALLFLVGLGLIWFFYGFQAALLGLLCMLGGLVPIGLVVLIMGGLDLFLKKINKN
jgi:magnesium-transporting ATPase (P-type)